VPQDYSEAVKWYRKAAEQGSASAENNLHKAGLKAAGVKIRYGVISAGAAVELVKAGNAGTDDDRVKIRGRVCLRLLRNRQ
jgi:TPR repeat protein